MRRMCHDCPHKEEHETGTSILVVKGTCGKPHRCHNAPHLPCVGHEMQLENIRRNLYQPEDFQNVASLYLVDAALSDVQVQEGVLYRTDTD